MGGRGGEHDLGGKVVDDDANIGARSLEALQELQILLRGAFLGHAEHHLLEVEVRKDALYEACLSEGLVDGDVISAGFVHLGQ